MEEDKRRCQANRAPKWNLAILVFLAVIVAAFVIGFGVFRYTHTFTAEKWRQAPEDRTKIVSDLLEKHSLLGMTQEAVFALLGEEDSYADTKTSFKISRAYYDPEQTLIYYLGIEYMDDLWLILSMENGVVTDCRIDVT